MNNIFSGKRKWILAAAVIIAVVLAGFLLLRRGSDSTGTAYVDTVANITGRSSELGIANRFAGVVESQETWSVNKNSDVEVEEIYVHVGQEVEEGEILFKYDISKYEEDLEEAEIELERMQNDYTSTQETLTQLQKEKQKASSSEQGNYTIQIKEQELALKDKELDIKLKQAEYDKLQNSIDTAEVTSGISGVVKSINDGSSNAEEGEDSGFITVMKVGDYRVKGTVSEQNIGEVAPNAKVIIYSRVNDDSWKGTIKSIDTENPESTSNNFFSSGNSNKGSRYPFYVELDSSDGLILGQHVYIQLELEDTNKDIKGIWVEEYLVDQSDPEHPFVWKDVNGRLRKQNVTLGDYKEEIGQIQILDGLTLTDSVAIPEESLREGMHTAPMDEKPEEETEETDGEMSSDGEEMEENMEEEMEEEMRGAEERMREKAGGGLEEEEDFEQESEYEEEDEEE